MARDDWNDSAVGVPGPRLAGYGAVIREEAPVSVARMPGAHRAPERFSSIFHGGEGEIRTRDRIAPMPVFKTGAFNRSATSPLSQPARRILPDREELQDSSRFFCPICSMRYQGADGRCQTIDVMGY
jgi:hypothetical protein